MRTWMSSCSFLRPSACAMPLHVKENHCWPSKPNDRLLLADGAVLETHSKLSVLLVSLSCCCMAQRQDCLGLAASTALQIAAHRPLHLKPHDQGRAV